MGDTSRRKRRALACALLLGIATPASAWTLDASTWARPRSGATIAAMPPLAEVVDAWSKRPGDRIVIRHPGGEGGDVWAAELRAWLVALGIPGGRIELVGGGEPEQLTLTVR